MARRTTIYLPETLHRRLRLLAFAAGSTIADLLRAAAEDRYEALFQEAEAVALSRQRPSPLLVKLTDELRSERFRRDRRFRWNRE